MAAPQGLSHRVSVGGEEELRAERAEVAVTVHAAREHRAPDVEPVPGDRVEHPEPGVHAVAREEDDVHPVAARREVVQREELSHRGERGTLAEHLVLARRLVAGIRLHPLAGEHPVALLEVEERARRDGDGENGRCRIDPIEKERQLDVGHAGGLRDIERQRWGRRNGSPFRPRKCEGKQVHGRHCRRLVAHDVSLSRRKDPGVPRGARLPFPGAPAIPSPEAGDGNGVGAGGGSARNGIVHGAPDIMDIRHRPAATAPGRRASPPRRGSRAWPTPRPRPRSCRPRRSRIRSPPRR